MNAFLKWGISLLLLSLPTFIFGQETSDTAAIKMEDGSKIKSPFKEYKRIITSEAKTDSGLFVIHFVGEKLYFEIPNHLLNKDMLLISRIAQIPANLSPYLNAGSKTGEQVIQWQRNKNRILLRVVSYSNVADESLPIHLSVTKNNFEPIIEAFNIEALSPDSNAVVIEVSKLFKEDVKALSGLNNSIRRDYKVTRLESSKSMIDTAKSFPINVEVIHTMTFGAGEPPSNSKTETISMQMNQSMILLPEQPMIPRLYDSRVGWFTVSQIDYSSEALKSDQKRYIRRWRLEPKDPEAYARGELVEPVKPIIYYLDPATPEKWRPYFKQGIEDWNDAFETAGFKNAIIAKDPPSPEDDPDFSPEDARYSTVRYVASTTRNAVGPSVSDPRTGEIIESDIIWYHNHLRSYRNRYLLETGAANPLARTLDTPESEIGEMMRRVISHEIGHALGLPHNMKASSAYPVDSLRSGTFTQKFGIASTIMDYARFNYVAQPEDKNIRFVRQLGPYDHYAINWGYRYTGAEKPEAEKSTLNQWILEKNGDPIYMFGSGFSGFDPRSQTECIGDNNTLASEYGIANLKRVTPELINWTSKPGEDYQDLEELYDELLEVWSRYLGHVVTNVGGVYETLKNFDQEGDLYMPVPETTQRQAMNFLSKEAFSTPGWLMNKNIISKIEASGALDKINNIQIRNLNALLQVDRMKRLIDAEALYGKSAYTLEEMMNDLQKSVWMELITHKPVDISRRNLQKAYLSRMEFLLKNEPPPSGIRNAPNATNTDIITLVKAQLKSLYFDLKKNLFRTQDSMTNYHIEDCMDRIKKILDREDLE